MNTQTQSVNTPRSWLKIVQIVVMLVIAVLLAAFTYNFVKNLVVTWEMTSLPGLAIKNPTPTPEPGDEVAPIEGEDPPIAEESAGPAGLVPDPWDGASRVTVLVMGLDYNDWRKEEGPPRTEPMILLTLDPISLTAGMLIYSERPLGQYSRV